CRANSSVSLASLTAYSCCSCFRYAGTFLRSDVEIGFVGPLRLSVAEGHSTSVLVVTTSTLASCSGCLLSRKARSDDGTRWRVLRFWFNCAMRSRKAPAGIELSAFLYLW